MAETVERARWYPEMPPMLPGEASEQYTDRLTGADGTGRRPYDHPRNRQCSIGYHGECSDPNGYRCKCPCHREPKTITASANGARRFRCLDCGFAVAADEDGCCVSCGRQCEIWTLTTQYEPDDEERVERELSPGRDGKQEGK